MFYGVALESICALGDRDVVYSIQQLTLFQAIHSIYQTEMNKLKQSITQSSRLGSY